MKKVAIWRGTSHGWLGARANFRPRERDRPSGPSGMAIALRRHPSLAVTYGILLMNTVASLIPFVWTLSNSFRTNTQIFAKVALIPEQVNFKNYTSIISAGGLPRAFFNSLTISLLSLALLLACVLPCSFLIARVRFRLSNALYLFFALAVFVPNIILLQAVYELLVQMKLLGYEYSICLVYAAAQLPFCIFLMVAFMKEVPPALEEAAIIDGAGIWKVFSRVVVPLSRNGIVTIVVLSFVAIWNDYIYAMVFLPEPQQRTLTVALAAVKSEYTVSYGLLSAAAVMAIAPVVIFYVFMKRYLVSGMSAGALKG